MLTRKLVAMLSLIYCCTLLSCISPGSYVYAEHYTVPIADSQLVKLTRSFKTQNVSFAIPPPSGLIDGKIDSVDHWYHVYFYYQDRNEIIHSWIRTSQLGESTLAFVGVNKGLELGHWKLINKDFSRSENKKQKEIFEERILKPMLAEIK